MSDSVSIYSEKAYRRDGGTFFEAIGNVVISSGKDTLYGERATFNTKTGEVFIEGSVRYIGQSLTIYGSKIAYNTTTEALRITNARMITPEFSIVASTLLRKIKNQYIAEDAEFTTCRDCTESWKIFGKKVLLEIDQYVQIYHGVLKVKGVDVLYLPYIALPVKNNRESGLLFPEISSKNEEGIKYEQPIFWAINDSKDMTFTPTFLSKRGYGLDLEYREIYGEAKWLNFSNKMVVDKIYLPNRDSDSLSGEQYFRHFFELENHYQWSNDFSQHMRVIGGKDRDILRDYSTFTEDYIDRNDIGLDLVFDKRFSSFSIGLETNYKRNLLIDDPLEFDDSYVQSLPSLNFSLMPKLLWQSERSYFYKSSFGFDGHATSFKQNRLSEPTYLRNANRFDISPYIDLKIVNFGPLILKTRYLLEYQEYHFLDEDEKRFYKHSGLVSTELSFTIDKIFGLAYEEKYNISEIDEKDQVRISKNKKLKETNVLSEQIIGVLPKIENSLTKETIVVKKNSYRHSQEFKFIHHKLVHNGEAGNEKFLNQISGVNGWFDHRDSIIKDILTLESTEQRQQIPVENTLEFQWNNVLMKKSTRRINYLLDDKYLKDNFSYSKLGYFNISQGVLLDDDIETIEEKLTRLHVSTGYSAATWSFSTQDYYNHQSGNHIMNASSQKKFDRLSLLAQYNYNSFSDSSQKTLKAGFQFRPLDVLGFSVLKEEDLNEEENISSIYQIDFMPNNNCWILNFNYKENFLEQRYAFKFEFNFGNEEFKNYRSQFFSFGRLTQ